MPKFVNLSYTGTQFRNKKPQNVTKFRCVINFI